MEKNERLGDRIRNQRAAIHMTQQELADRLGVTGAAVSAYEKGARSPSLDILMRISKVLGVTTDELLAGKKQVVMLDVTNLTHEQRVMIHDMIKALEEYNAMKSIISENKKLNDKLKLLLEFYAALYQTCRQGAAFFIRCTKSPPAP